MSAPSNQPLAKTPKQRLLEIYQIYKAAPPTFGIQPGPPAPAPPLFLCTVVIDSIQSKHGSFAKQEFQAEASSKKAAVHGACTKAVDFIKAQGLLPEGYDTPEPQEAVNAAAEFLAGMDASVAAADPGQTPSEGGGEELSEVDAALLAALEGRSLDSLGPMELKEELEKALARNNVLNHELTHERARRQNAVSILLGLS